MTLLEKIEYHRCECATAPVYSDRYYKHMREWGKLVRQWRQANALRSVK